jgi:transcriptional regulator with XRE-family HTH domain
MLEDIITKNIKTVRKRKKMTLQKLADLTGLSKGYLSRVERSKKAPPYSTLNKIAIALGVDPAVLLKENLHDLRDNRISFTKKKDRKTVQKMDNLVNGILRDYGYTYEALSSDKPGKNMEPYIIEPTPDEKGIFQHEGEEFLYVLEGKHELVYDGKKYLMEEGDCVYFDSAVPHTGKSIGKKKTKLLAVMFNYKRM